MIKCKNCGASDFNEGKCSFCGTEIGFTGESYTDAYLLTLKRIKILEEAGFTLELVEVIDSSKDPENEWYFSSRNYTYRYGGYEYGTVPIEIRMHNNQHPDEIVNTMEELEAYNKKKWEEDKQRRIERWKTHPAMIWEWQATKSDGLAMTFDRGNTDINLAVEYFIKKYFSNKTHVLTEKYRKR